MIAYRCLGAVVCLILFFSLPCVPDSSGQMLPGLPPFTSFFNGQSWGACPLGSRLGGLCRDPLVLNVKFWYAAVNTRTVVWGPDFFGRAGTTLDLRQDLGLQNNISIPEFEVIANFASDWSLRFSYMPIKSSNGDDFLPTGPFPLAGFFFGTALFPTFVTTRTDWDRLVYRGEIGYSVLRGALGISNVFLGLTRYDDNLTIKNFFTSRSRSQNIWLGSVGVGLERGILNLGNGAASLNGKVSVLFGEGNVGWEGYVVGRFDMPTSRYSNGYFEAGWRWLVLNRTSPTDTDKVNLGGFTATFGLVF